MKHTSPCGCASMFLKGGFNVSMAKNLFGIVGSGCTTCAGDKLVGTGDIAHPPTSGPVLILSRAVKRSGPPKSKVDVHNPPICGPLVILPRALQRWRTRVWQE